MPLSTTTSFRAKRLPKSSRQYSTGQELLCERPCTALDVNAKTSEVCPSGKCGCSVRYLLAHALLTLALLTVATAACRPAARPVPEVETTTPSPRPMMGQSPLSPPATPEPAEPEQAPTPRPEPETSPIATPSDGSDDALTAVAEYLAGELGVTQQRLQPVLIEPTEWPDASLGCPEPGETYAQSITPGYRVVLMVDGKEYEVHTDQAAERVVMCEHKLKPGADFAVEHLAGELGIPAEEIELQSIARYEWPDASMGCPEPGRVYAQVVTQGYSVVLMVSGEEYEVHTDLEGRAAVTCQPDA